MGSKKVELLESKENKIKLETQKYVDEVAELEVNFKEKSEELIKI